MNGNYILERSQVISRSRRETFAFFGDAFNLERITPALLRFRILSSRPVRMKEGTLIEYRLALFGIPFRWKTLIEEWSPESYFVDVQLKGPYKLWRHTHSFEEIGPSRTVMRDRVEYQIGFGPLGRLVHSLFVGRMLKNIFDYRAEMTARLLGQVTEQ
ncbi:MAG TPA: SRPBCC family protein [Blastocatellia bacterium]|nr:SRPBCC family protein [Blastocatellia bacterium]